MNEKKYIGTIIIGILNMVTFFYLSFFGMTENGYYMLEHGAMYAPFFLEKQEYYRIITSLFLHFGFEHLMNNMVTLIVIGRYLEPLVGRFRFILIYFISGITGNVLSFIDDLIFQDYHISAGASGAIFGLTGALLCLAILNRGQIGEITKQNMMVMIALSLYNGFVEPGVDNFAHIGGLIAGFLVTFILCFKRYANRCTDIDS